MAKDSSILRTYYYHCPPYISHAPTEEEKRRQAISNGFFTSLERLPRFQVRLGKLEKRGIDKDTGAPIFQQKRVDLMLGIDMVSLAATSKIEKAILLAGDSDFVPAVQMVKNFGVQVILWHGPSWSFHNVLWQQCDGVTKITQEVINSCKKPL
jgi:uncharacterized LabA/DUF88 family protein